MCTLFEFSFSIVFAFALNAIAVSGQNTYNASVRLYTRPTLNDFVSYDLTTAHNVADNAKYNPSRTTVLFVHGWNQSPSGHSSHQGLLNAFLSNGNFNVMVLDWTQAASSLIIDTAVARIDTLGKELALFIDRLNSQKGIPFDKLHFIGHSIGAHVSGIAGRYTRDWSASTKYFGRITGLDPGQASSDHLQWRHARFVDLIHTDANGFGSDQNNGHIDFWPNNGVSPQPGCYTSLCSHFRSIELFTESVIRANRPGNFLAKNNADQSIVYEMGLNTPITARGIYTLYTNSASWYSQS